MAATAVIEGQPTVIVERKPPIQPTLDRLLSALTSVTVRNDITPRGTSRSCEVLREHRFGVLREGRHVGLDGIVRDLRVLMCADCGACQVRDISRDRIAGLPIGRGGPARRDLVLGWYSGARRNRREYR